MEVLGNIIYCSATVATIGLLFAGCVEVYAYVWNRVNEIKKGKK